MLNFDWNYRHNILLTDCCQNIQIPIILTMKETSQVKSDGLEWMENADFNPWDFLSIPNHRQIQPKVGKKTVGLSEQLSISFAKS